MKIWKHTPCTVIAWDLHAEDKQQSRDGQRMLQAHPLCIYLKFEGATWQVHKGLPLGVFPLAPVKRNWALNRNKAEPKVDRWGFTLLPDYACTAHMVQGMTLPGLLADCGDLLDRPGLKDMLAAYVALSRVTKADGLFLLRCFSKTLFVQGSPAGPYCLMKLLRARLGHITDEAYDYDAAVEEYKSLMQKASQERADRKEKGSLWTCSCCQVSYPAEGFDATAGDAAEVFEKCVRPGHWVICTACACAQESHRANPLAPHKVRVCPLCNVSRSSQHYEIFDDDMDSWCRQCDLQRHFLLLPCKICHKQLPCLQFPKAKQRNFKLDEPNTLPTCSRCMPDPGVYKCTVCQQVLARSAFYAASLWRRNANRFHLRCKACHTCERCGTLQTDARRLASDKRLCTTCLQVTCGVCLESKSSAGFPAAQIYNASHVSQN